MSSLYRGSLFGGTPSSETHIKNHQCFMHEECQNRKADFIGVSLERGCSKLSYPCFMREGSQNPGGPFGGSSIERNAHKTTIRVSCVFWKLSRHFRNIFEQSPGVLEVIGGVPDAPGGVPDVSGCFSTDSRGFPMIVSIFVPEILAEFLPSIWSYCCPHLLCGA